MSSVTFSVGSEVGKEAQERVILGLLTRGKFHVSLLSASVSAALLPRGEDESVQQGQFREKIEQTLNEVEQSLRGASTYGMLNVLTPVDTMDCESSYSSGVIRTETKSMNDSPKVEWEKHGNDSGSTGVDLGIQRPGRTPRRAEEFTFVFNGVPTNGKKTRDDVLQTPALNSSNFTQAVAPQLHVELWRSQMLLFDHVVGTADISLLPLLLNPTEEVSISFPVLHVISKTGWGGGQSFPIGHVRLRMRFEPRPAGVGETRAMAPTSNIENIKSNAGETRKEDEPVLNSTNRKQAFRDSDRTTVNPQHRVVTSATTVEPSMAPMVTQKTDELHLQGVIEKSEAAKDLEPITEESITVQPANTTTSAQMSPLKSPNKRPFIPKLDIDTVVRGSRDRGRTESGEKNKRPSLQDFDEVPSPTRPNHSSPSKAPVDSVLFNLANVSPSKKGKTGIDSKPLRSPMSQGKQPLMSPGGHRSSSGEKERVDMGHFEFLSEDDILSNEDGHDEDYIRRYGHIQADSIPGTDSPHQHRAIHALSESSSNSDGFEIPTSRRTDDEILWGQVQQQQHQQQQLQQEEVDRKTPNKQTSAPIPAVIEFREESLQLTPKPASPIATSSGLRHRGAVADAIASGLASKRGPVKHAKYVQNGARRERLLSTNEAVYESLIGQKNDLMIQENEPPRQSKKREGKGEGTSKQSDSEEGNTSDGSDSDGGLLGVTIQRKSHIVDEKPDASTAEKIIDYAWSFGSRANGIIENYVNSEGGSFAPAHNSKVAHINPLGATPSFRGAYNATSRAVSAIREERKTKRNRQREAKYSDVLAMLEKHPKLKKPFTKRCVGRSYIHLVSVDTIKRVHEGDDMSNKSGTDATTAALDSATAERNSDFYTGKQPFDQYYVTVSMDDATYEEKTQTVGSGYNFSSRRYTQQNGSQDTAGKYSSDKGDPDSIYFNKYFCLLARHYESKICISLHDAKTNRRVGYAETSIFRIMQRDGDYYNSDWTMATYENLPMTDGRNGERSQYSSHSYRDTIIPGSDAITRRLNIRPDDDGSGVLFQMTTSTIEPRGEHKAGAKEGLPSSSLDAVFDSDYVGAFRCRILFEEDLQGLFLGTTAEVRLEEGDDISADKRNFKTTTISVPPRYIPERLEEPISVEKMTVHIARFQYLWTFLMEWVDEYESFMNWDQPWWTGANMIAFVLTTLYVDAEYVLMVPMGMLALFLTYMLYRRKYTGKYKAYWLTKKAHLSSHDGVRAEDINARVAAKSAIKRAKKAKTEVPGTVALALAINEPSVAETRKILDSYTSPTGLLKVCVQDYRCFCEGIKDGNTVDNAPISQHSYDCAGLGTKYNIFNSLEHSKLSYKLTYTPQREQINVDLERVRYSVNDFIESAPSLLGRNGSYGQLTRISSKPFGYADLVGEREYLIGNINDPKNIDVSGSSALGAVAGIMRSFNFLGDNENSFRDGLLQDCVDPWEDSIYGSIHYRNHAKLESEATSTQIFPSFIYPLLKPKQLDSETIAECNAIRQNYAEGVLAWSVENGGLTASEAEEEGNLRGSYFDVVSDDEYAEETRVPIHVSADQPVTIKESMKAEGIEGSPKTKLNLNFIGEDPEMDAAYTSWRDNCGLIRIYVYDHAVTRQSSGTAVADEDSYESQNKHHGSGVYPGKHEASGALGVVTIYIRDIIAEARQFKLREQDGSKHVKGSRGDVVRCSTTADFIDIRKWCDINPTANAINARGVAAKGSQRTGISHNTREYIKKCSNARNGTPQILVRIKLDFKRNTVVCSNFADDSPGESVKEKPDDAEHVSTNDTRSAGASIRWQSLVLKDTLCNRLGAGNAAAGSNTGSPRAGAISRSSSANAADSQAKKAVQDKSGYFSALTEMPENIKFVQNLLSWLLDMTESTKNILNWTLPKKTFPVYIAVIIIFILCVLIPNRYIVLVIGLVQYLAKFFPKSKKVIRYDEHGNVIEEESSNSPILVNLYNLIQSIPNDFDLESTIYNHERRELAKRSIIFKRNQLRKAKLSLCLPCYWSEQVEIKLVGVGSMGSLTATQHAPSGSSMLGDVGGMIFGRSDSASVHSSSNASTPWRSIFLALQGQRLVWWASESDLTVESSQPEGQLLLYGHAGTTDASPVDLKEAGKDNMSKVISIFGNDINGSHIKCTVLCSSDSSKNRLVQQVNKILNRT